MIKLGKLLKESLTWGNRKFGERLPTTADYREAYNKKNGITEDGITEGPSYEYANYMKKIEKAENNQAKEVNNFVKLLMKKGLKKEASTVASKYVKGVAEFDNLIKSIYDKIT